MGAHAHMLVLYTHIQKQETQGSPPAPPTATTTPDSLLLSHNAMHFIYNEVFLRGIHLSELFSSHFCHISLSVPIAGPFPPPPPADLKAKSSWNKRNKYYISYIMS